MLLKLDDFLDQVREDIVTAKIEKVRAQFAHISTMSLSSATQRLVSVEAELLDLVGEYVDINDQEALRNARDEFGDEFLDLMWERYYLERRIKELREAQ